jgi:hypothetical protein
VKKFVAVVAVLAPTLTFLPAAPASADSVCLPITIDGQQVCQDLTLVEQEVASAEATVAAVADQALAVVATAQGLAVGVVESVAGPEYDGTSYCDRLTQEPNGVVVSVGTFGPPPTPHADNDIGQCTSYDLTIEANGATGVTPVHVPQVCVTTTGTCVGGIDTGVPTPQVSYTVCLLPYTQVITSTGPAQRSDGTSVCLPAA